MHQAFVSGNQETAGELITSSQYPNTVSKQIVLNIDCQLARADFTPASLTSYHDDCIPEFARLTYEPSNDSFFILSGMNKQGKMLYKKGIMKDGSYFGLSLSYGREHRTMIEKYLPPISNSFQ